MVCEAGMIPVVVNIAFETDGGIMDNWWKERRMISVPRIGEWVWIEDNYDYLVTGVSWNIESGRCSVRCADNGHAEQEWIDALIRSGFTTERPQP